MFTFVDYVILFAIVLTFMDKVLRSVVYRLLKVAQRQNCVNHDLYRLICHLSVGLYPKLSPFVLLLLRLARESWRHRVSVIKLVVESEYHEMEKQEDVHYDTVALPS